MIKRILTLPNLQDRISYLKKQSKPCSLEAYYS